MKMARKTGICVCSWRKNHSTSSSRVSCFLYFQPSAWAILIPLCHTCFFFFPLPIDAGHEQGSAADVLAFPPRPHKTRDHSRPGVQNFSQPMVANTCKGLRLQPTNDRMHAGGPGPDHKEKESTAFSLYNGEPGESVVVQYTQVIIE